MTATSLVGQIGTLCAAVRGGELPGEVRVVVQGLPHYYLAFCTEAIPVGKQVLVINNRGSLQVDVEPWALPGPTLPGLLDSTERQ